ncbi:right-handed parallel beta-helix repeat-containing protein [uncultured Friedmanniella sp.]|uniref:right-handed parallel beta-helix repeat-containing protein n=1 Tax=uncultured Friedmanniella sp. TaxID=335381 RepID=UPI0035CBA68E
MGAFPAASTTGVPSGVALTPTGGLTITQPGAVVNGLDITGPVVVRAAGVTIRNSRIKGSGDDAFCVQTQGAGTLTIEDSEISGGCENGIGFDDWTARRVEIRGTFGDGVKLGSDVLLEDSWIHDLAPAAGAHADGGQVQSGVTDTVVRHNTIDLATTSRANAALFLAPDLGPTTNGPLIIENNKLNGGNYTVFCVDGADGRYVIRSISIRGNHFGDNFTYGRSNVNVPILQSANVVDSTGAALTL